MVFQITAGMLYLRAQSFLMRILIPVLVFFCLMSCAKKKSSSFEPINSFAAAEALGECDKKLEEVSGLVASLKNPGFFWAINDSGNDAKVFLINDKANIVFTCELSGIENRDWEDIAVGPGPEDSKNYIYVAEIGDNDALYTYKYIYRFEEPVFTTDEKKIDISEVDKITFKLQGIKKDTEALLLDTKTKDLFIISKREQPVYVYQLKYPHSLTDTLTAVPILSLPMKQVTAGDVSHDQKEILIKNYNEIFYWHLTEGETLIQALSRNPVTIPYTPEPQGESIAWAYNDNGFYTISERVKHKDSPLYFFKRK